MPILTTPRPLGAVALLLSLALTLAGCQLAADDSSPVTRHLRERPARGQEGGAADGGALLDSTLRELERLRTIAAEKDSALAQVRVTQDLIDEIERELAVIPGVGDGSLQVGGTEGMPDDIRAVVLERIERARSLVEHADSAIRARDLRIRELAGDVKGRDRTIDSLRASSLDLLALLDRQRLEVTRLTIRVEELEREREDLLVQTTALSDTVAALRGRERTVYVAIGTEAELLARGVVVREGGAQLGFWRPGQTLQPARVPPRAAFRVLDMEQDREIALPDPAATYHIVSKHSPQWLEGIGADSLVRGQLRVAAPRRFWESGRYLILVAR